MQRTRNATAAAGGLAVAGSAAAPRMATPLSEIYVTSLNQLSRGSGLVAKGQCSCNPMITLLHLSGAHCQAAGQLLRGVGSDLPIACDVLPWVRWVCHASCNHTLHVRVQRALHRPSGGISDAAAEAQRARRAACLEGRRVSRACSPPATPP